MLSKGMVRALGLLLTSHDREIMCEGLICMIDQHTIAARTVLGLLGHMAIKDAGYAGAGCRIYIPTKNSNAIYQNPELADAMVMRVVQHKPFFIDRHGKIQDA